jgi:hypothetical protein
MINVLIFAEDVTISAASVAYFRDTQVLQKFMRYPNILDARWMTWSKFSTQDPRILGAW